MTEQTALTPFQQQYQKALREYKTTAIGGNHHGTYMEAEAGAGSRYSVVIAPLPYPGGRKEGGQHLISLLQPWQANMVFTIDEGEIHADYVLEKLIPRDRTLATVHGGDAAAIVITVNTAARLFLNAVKADRRATDKLMGVDQ